MYTEYGSETQKDKNNSNIAITKIQMAKVYAGEYKKVHTRSMELDASFGAVGHIAHALELKGNNRLIVEDLAYAPDIVTYSDKPSAMPIDVNGGWMENRYSFMMEITLYKTQTSIDRIYLSGYTDKDDVFSLSGEMNPEVELIFNDVLVTNTTMDLSTGRENTRIITAAEILPTPELGSDRDATLTPADVYKTQQGRMYITNETDSSFATNEDARVSLVDFRLKNRGGKISRKQNSSLDSHLVSVANRYLQEKAKDDMRTESDVIADLTFSSREPDARQAIALFRMLDDINIKNTNAVKIGDLLSLCPMYFKSPLNDYVILDKMNGAPDLEIKTLVTSDRKFNALTTRDSISTASTNVETKLAYMLLQEVMALMSMYKVTTVGISMTNLSNDRDNRALIAIPRFDSFVRSKDLSVNLYESFKDALYNVFNKVTSRNTLTIEAHLFIGINTEKVEIAVEGGHKVVLSLPRFMSSHFSNVVGSSHDLTMLADGYNSLFKEIGDINPSANTQYRNQDQYLNRR